MSLAEGFGCFVKVVDNCYRYKQDISLLYISYTYFNKFKLRQFVLLLIVASGELYVESFYIYCISVVSLCCIVTPRRGIPFTPTVIPSCRSLLGLKMVKPQHCCFAAIRAWMVSNFRQVNRDLAVLGSVSVSEHW